MKTNFLSKPVVGIALAALCLAGSPSLQLSGLHAQPAPPSDMSAPPDGGAAALPPNIDPNSPLAQVIRLVQANVDQEVILTFITNSTGTFNLDSDKIIYLRDIGVSSDLVNAMMQRDQVLQANPPPAPPPPTTPDVAPPPVDQPATVTVNYFYDTLSPYGNWVEVPDYGWCWRPTVVVVNPGWQPYCDSGHWVYTDCGWYWMSDYSWGWATFHYGRWFHNPRFGWCWWPDTVWAPSWVCWRQSAGYCGWAPLPPFTGYVSGVGFCYRGVAVSAGFNFGLSVGDFFFCSTRNFCDPHPWRHRIARDDAPRIFNQTTIINNYGFDDRRRAFINHGIPPRDIAAVTHQDIRPVTIRDTDFNTRRGSQERWERGDRTLDVARPHFAENTTPERLSGNRDFRPHFTPPTPGQNVQSTPMANRDRNAFSPNTGPAVPDNRNSARQDRNWQASQPARAQSPQVGSPAQNSRDFTRQNRDWRANPPAQPQPSAPQVGSPVQDNRSFTQPNRDWRANQTSQPQPTQSPRLGAPVQNQFSQPGVNQPTRWNQNANAGWQGQNFVDDKHVASPRGQQFDQQTPHFNPQASQRRDYSQPAQSGFNSPAVNQPAPVERSYNPPPRNDSRPSYSAPPARASAPQQSVNSGGSRGGNNQQNQNQNQNGRGNNQRN